MFVVNFLVDVEDDSPAVESDVLGIDHILEQVDGVLTTVVARPPAQYTGQVIASAEGDDSTGRVLAFRVLTHVVQTLQHPPDGTITTTHQDLVLLHLSEHIQAGGWRATVNIIVITETHYWLLTHYWIIDNEGFFLGETKR